MFFRLRGNNVQLVKSIAQPDGKAKNVGAGSINLVTGKENLNDEVKLTSEDKTEIKEWLVKQKETHSLEAQLRAKTIDKTIQLLVNDVQADRVLVGKSDLRAIEYAFRQLRQAVTKKNDDASMAS